MTREIERKFLVAGDGWRDACVRKVHLRDGLLVFSDDRKLRIRFYDDQATLCFKGPREGISRDEYEFGIPTDEGLELLGRYSIGEVLEKTRYHVPFEGSDWTVDEYFGRLAGVVIAEIELSSEDAGYRKPPWLGREVTGMPEYRKINMMKARGLSV